MLIDFPPDSEAIRFIAREEDAPQPIWKWAARRMLRPFAGDFTLNGLLGTYPLHLLSTAQWHALLGEDVGGRLLDVGAACGDVTSQLAPLFESVTTTEVNSPMVRRLRERGFEAHHLDITEREAPGGPFDTVAALNVLDRCPRPVTLLDSLIDASVPGGHLIFSMPLPYDPCWYKGPKLAPPKERLPIRHGAPFEAASRTFAAFLESHGLRVRAMGRAPYLSGGDRHRPIYKLDAVLVLAQRPGGHYPAPDDSTSDG